MTERDKLMYLYGLTKGMSLIDEQREEEGGEACCALREVVALDNASYLIEQHVCAVRDEEEEPDTTHLWWREGN